MVYKENSVAVYVNNKIKLWGIPEMHPNICFVESVVYEMCRLSSTFTGKPKIIPLHCDVKGGFFWGVF